MARQPQIVMLDSYVHTTFDQYTRYNENISKNLTIPNKLFKVVGRLHLEVDLNNFKILYIEKFVRHRQDAYMKNFITALEYEMMLIIVEFRLKDGETFVFDFKYGEAIYRREAKCYFFSKVL
jgi:hypothetical protein